MIKNDDVKLFKVLRNELHIFLVKKFHLYIVKDNERIKKYIEKLFTLNDHPATKLIDECDYELETLNYIDERFEDYDENKIIRHLLNLNEIDNLDMQIEYIKWIIELSSILQIQTTEKYEYVEKESIHVIRYKFKYVFWHISEKDLYKDTSKKKILKKLFPYFEMGLCKPIYYDSNHHKECNSCNSMFISGELNPNYLNILRQSCYK